MKPIYRVTIEVTREEEKLQSREYLGADSGGVDGSAYGPQRLEISEVDRILAKITVKDLKVATVIRSILANSKPA